MEKAQGRIQAVCDKLCEEFKRSVPLKPASGKGKKLSEREILSSTEAALARFYQFARNEIKTNHFGMIGRARVAFGLQQRLLGAGYPAPMVKQILFAMLTSVFVGTK